MDEYLEAGDWIVEQLTGNRYPFTQACPTYDQTGYGKRITAQYADNIDSH